MSSADDERSVSTERRVAEYIWDQSLKTSSYKSVLPSFNSILFVEKYHLCPKLYGCIRRHSCNPPCEQCEPRIWTSTKCSQGRLHNYRHPYEYSLRELCIVVIKIKTQKV